MYKVLFITFGCKVNHYETECMKETFRSRKWEVVGEDCDTDAVVINSCTVTASGDSRVLAALRKARARYPEAVIALTGCYPQADPEGASKLMDADRAIAVISDFIAANPGSADAYVMRGLKYFGRGNRALAINDFLEAHEIQPDSVATKTALDSANSILDFYNKDLFNP